MPTHSDLCVSADRCTGNRMHSYQHRIPQHTILPSFTPQNTSRMVREPHRTHGNKTRICSFTDSRTTICAPCHTPTPISTASSLVFHCPFTPTSTIPQPQRASPRSYVSRRYPGPMYVILTPFATQHRYHADVSFAFLSLALRDRISGYTPQARPRALTGLRLPAVGSHNTCFPGRTYGCP